MNNNLYAKVIFNKIIGKKSRITIDLAPIPPNTDYYRVYYKYRAIGVFTLYKPNMTSNKFKLHVFGQKYISNPLPFLTNPNTIDRLFDEFLAKLGLTLDEK